jgi:CRISPR-associated protein Cmr3
VGIDSGRKRPEEGLLYQVEYVRAHKDVGLLVEVTGLDEFLWGTRGLLSLGGEQRAAQYEVLRGEFLPQSAPVENRFKAYFATPTYLDGGWTTDWGRYFSSAPMLKAAAVRRYQPIGGWDVARNQQKPLRRYVPAASVYFIEAQAPFGKPSGPICDDAIEAQMGFGVYFTGRW